MHGADERSDGSFVASRSRLLECWVGPPGRSCGAGQRAPGEAAGTAEGGEGPTNTMCDVEVMLFPFNRAVCGADPGRFLSTSPDISAGDFQRV